MKWSTAQRPCCIFELAMHQFCWAAFKGKFAVLAPAGATHRMHDAAHLPFTTSAGTNLFSINSSASPQTRAGHGLNQSIARSSLARFGAVNRRILTARQ